MVLSVGTIPASDIAVYDLKSHLLTKRTFNGQMNRGPLWSPDGKHILYVSQIGSGSSFWWVRADGADDPQLLFESKETLLPTSFSPDGRLAYTASGGETTSDIWILPLDLRDPAHPKPGTPEPFLRTPAAELDAAFSPDGRWIAYTSSETGYGEVYVRRFQPSENKGGHWQISTSGGGKAVWSPDGRRLFYQAPNGLVMAVDCAMSGDSFSHLEVQPWYDRPLVPGLSQTPNFAVSPTGNRLLVVARPGSLFPESNSTLHIGVLVNFFDELRHRVP